jgi:hypothetical protein
LGLGYNDIIAITDVDWSYAFSVRCLNNITTTVGIENGKELPTEYSLSQNYPNPFNSNTKIKYKLPSDSHVHLKVYDLVGREVKDLVNKQQSAGAYEVNFNASNLSSGVYYYKLSAGDYTAMKKMIFLK